MCIFWETNTRQTLWETLVCQKVSEQWPVRCASGQVCCCLVTKSCPNLCDAMDCSPPGSSVHRIFRQEYWSGLPLPPPRNLPDPGIEHSFSWIGRWFFTTESQGSWSGDSSEMCRTHLPRMDTYCVDPRELLGELEHDGDNDGLPVVGGAEEL